MSSFNALTARVACVVLAFLSLSAPCVIADAVANPLKEGDRFTIGSSAGVLVTLHTLPYVDDDYTRRFSFDAHGNPKLKELRQRYHLDQVVAPGKTEFDRQVLLLDWVNHYFKKFGRPSSPARGALDILAAVDEGNSFFCAHYGDVMVSAAASLGWVDRALALRRPDSPGRGGSTEHTSTEIWSNQFGKWILFDPTFAMYVVKEGSDVPLNAYEFRQQWFYRDGKDLVFILDKDRKHYRKSDMPVPRGTYPGFGALVFDPGATDVYAFIGYIPNTNFMDGGPDYGKMFITKDALCDTTKWHQRQNPADPTRDPYFPINQAAITLTADAKTVHVSLKTLTPNFKTYMKRLDAGQWSPTDAAFTWTPHPGKNVIEVKSVNQFDVEGPVSSAELNLSTAE